MNLMLMRHQFYKHKNMKIILTESQTKRLIRLMESMSLEDYKTDLQKIIDGDQVFTKGMDSYKYNSGVAAVQSGLDKLNYTFNKFGIDGKFGNETLKNVEKIRICEETSEYDLKSSKKTNSDIKELIRISEN